MTAPEFEQMIYEERDGIAFITLNRPERLNALTGTLHGELYKAWEYILLRDEVKAVVITGNGRAFCSGADLVERGEARKRGTVIEREKRQPNILPSRIELTGSFPDNNMFLEFDKPIVAAVNGLAVGAGTMILGACDVFLATDGAYLADAHVTSAGWPGTGEALDVADQLPWGEMMRFSIEGVRQRISSERARQLGFYCEVVPQEQLVARAEEIARMLAAQPAGALKALRRIARRSRDAGLHDTLTFGRFEQRRLQLASEAH